MNLLKSFVQDGQDSYILKEALYWPWFGERIFNKASFQAEAIWFGLKDVQAASLWEAVAGEVGVFAGGESRGEAETVSDDRMLPWAVVEKHIQVQRFYNVSEQTSEVDQAAELVARIYVWRGPCSVWFSGHTVQVFIFCEHHSSLCGPDPGIGHLEPVWVWPYVCAAAANASSAPIGRAFGTVDRCIGNGTVQPNHTPKIKVY